MGWLSFIFLPLAKPEDYLGAKNRDIIIIILIIIVVTLLFCYFYITDISSTVSCNNILVKK